jgi:predicted TIM-barrel fold metal-dependent hydrolase
MGGGGDYTEFRKFTEYRIFDADQHLNEGPDCFDRYLEPAYRERTLRFEERDGARVALVEGRPIPLHGGPGRKMVRPGSLKEMLQTLKKGGGASESYQYIDIDPALEDPELRLAQLDRQNVEACFLFSNGAGLVLEHYVEDEDLYYATSWAYLKWLNDEWGFSRQGRLFVSPIFSMRNPARTAEQLDWFFEHGGKALTMVPGPAYGRSPAHRDFDPVWSRINEASAVVTYHINEAMPSYKAVRSAQWGEPEHPAFFEQSAWQWYWAYGDVPAQETFVSLVYGNLFARFPGLRIVSAEHGCEWLPLFLNKIDKMRGMGRNGPWLNGQLAERPSAVFRRHFTVVPFWEDNIKSVVDQVGPDLILGGSDFPHSEGLAFPTQLVEHLDFADDHTQRQIMRERGLALIHN